MNIHARSMLRGLGIVLGVPLCCLLFLFSLAKIGLWTLAIIAPFAIYLVGRSWEKE